ncbi:MAG TPA: 4-alpha-glucanotransferase [Tepidisphaeraceae bacterium]|nr:4-alpha-glucanotransferase [Tepidisphaeraceae bacterium]
MPKPLSLTGRRTSGLLLHPSSLPGAHGSGDLGPAAAAFVGFLAAGGQKWWQMLPVGPPGAAPGFSPYSSYSAFAGSAFLISLELLAGDGLLSAKEIAAPASVRRGSASLQEVFDFRESRLRLAYQRFSESADAKLVTELEDFVREHGGWLDDFALFSAIKNHHDGKSWTQWPVDLRLRRPAALRAASEKLADEVRYHRFVQLLFDRQWRGLRALCAERGIGLIGDIPIFVALDSADVWANPHLFLLDRQGRPTVVSGCPPDAFSSDGQLWGHPHYDWAEHRRENFAWWTRRFQSMLYRFDAVRIDHFLGFHRVWAVPARAKTAKAGDWLAGPREEIFRAVNKVIGKVPVIAEDLGAVTREAEALRDKFKYPGMRVMQFGFGDGGSFHLPHNYPRRSVAYTGTHDNDTAVGWFRSLPSTNGRGAKRAGGSGGGERAKAIRYLDLRDLKQVHWSMIRAAMLSPADTVIFPVQDVLGLGGEARMNVPGVAERNWTWRFRNGALTNELARRLKELADLSDRTGS